MRNRKRLMLPVKRAFIGGMRSMILGLLLLSFSGAVRAQDEPTAYEALRVIGTQINRALVTRVISITGEKGDPQPRVWHVLLSDRNSPTGLREIDVTSGRITGERTPPGPAERATIKTARLNLDSSGAFAVASHTADSAHLNFSYASYGLSVNPRGEPSWTVTLENEARGVLGTIYIGANRGTVTRVEGMFRGRDAAEQELQVGQNPENHEVVRKSDISDDDEDDGDVNPVKAQIKRMFKRTKHDAERLFDRVGRSFDDFFRRR